MFKSIKPESLRHRRSILMLAGVVNAAGAKGVSTPRSPAPRLPFETVRERIVELLKASVEERALRQYVSILAGQAEVSGIDLQIADSPLVQ
jgi:hypothetical protein